MSEGQEGYRSVDPLNPTEGERVAYRSVDPAQPVAGERVAYESVDPLNPTQGERVAYRSVDPRTTPLLAREKAVQAPTASVTSTPGTPLLAREEVVEAPAAQVSPTPGSSSSGGGPQQLAYKSTGPDDSPETLPSQNPAYTSSDDGSGSGSSGSTTTTDNTIVQNVDGKLVTGYATQNGGFMSNDGTVYVPSGGPPQYGITDPTTGNFLQGGTTRVIDGQTVYGTVQKGVFVSEDNTLLQLPSGFVEHGKTDASGNFLAETTVNGQQVWGNYADNGDFMSSDGTIYVPAGKPAEFGITDPTTGNFLEGGSTRVIDGQTVYGTVSDNGDFISEDHTLLQQPNGFVEHGYIDSNNDFIAQLTVDGKQVSGNYGDDGSFMSLDGTIYVPPGGAPEYGVTDPGSKSFLPGGTTYTLPNGTVLYGYKEPDGSFWSYNGSEIVLSNGTAVAGTLQKGDGIFTGNNGNYYFVGQNGITQITPNKDGSFSMPDGSVVMTPQSWKTDLNDFQNAQTQIGTYISNISDDYSNIQMQYSMIESFWSSPAGTSFTEATSAVDLAMQKLNTVLSSITTAMQTSYNNYYASEQQAITTFNNANSASPS